MRADDLFKAMNGIDEKFLEESENTENGRNKILKIRRYVVVAACACFAIAIGLYVPNAFRMGRSDLAYEESFETAEESNDAIYDEKSEGAALEVEGEAASDSIYAYNISLYINDEYVDVSWEDNEAVNAIKEVLVDGDITLEMSPYGGFEVYSKIDLSIPAQDEQLTAESGDIVLYNGDTFAVLYDSNTADYTKLGKIYNLSNEELKELLENESVTIALRLE
ncbi:MAG: hypothetical protein K6E13_06190 [Lachnospiraceae bacterium]|nr:hypothetical protein [Lachnospiraceae bacterium]